MPQPLTNPAPHEERGKGRGKEYNMRILVKILALFIDKHSYYMLNI